METRVLTRDQSRQFDRAAQQRFGISSLVLMENAGRGCVDQLGRRGINGGVVVCCGRGNNGGDGLVIARHLAIRGHAARVLLFCDPAELSTDARANYQIAARSGIDIESPPKQRDELTRMLTSVRGQRTDWIVDAWLGTGARPPLREPLSRVVPLVNKLPARRMAVDLPTGLDCDSGQISEPVFRADLTCTFVALKPVMTTAGGKEVCGEIEVLDIGATDAVFAAVDEKLG